MAGFCEYALLVGLTFGGACEELPNEDLTMPEPDASMLEYKEPEPPPPPPPEPEPEPVPVFTKPIVIKETVYVEKPAPAPPPRPIVRRPPPPDPMEDYLAASIAARRVGMRRIEAGSNTASDLAAIAPGAVPTVSTQDTSPSPSGTGYQWESRTAGAPTDNTRTVTTDRYIHGVLEVGVNSQLETDEGGEVIIQVSRDVSGYHNRDILIPKGSRLTCQMEGLKKAGQTRVGMLCTRLLLAGSRREIAFISGRVGDVQGHTGVSGQIEKRFWERYGSAILISAISATVQGAASYWSSGTDGASPLQESAAELSEKFGEITATMLERTVDLKDVLRISQGARVVIRPQFDWYIPVAEGKAQ